ncbi:MAG: DUF881 domain-containing protein [Bacillota bacterium]
MAINKKRAPLARWQVTVTIVLLFTGILLSLQFRTQQDFRQTLAAQKTDDLVVIWKRLLEKRERLELEVEGLQKQQLLLEQKSTAGLNALSQVAASLERLRMSQGLDPVKGPGITITITGDAPLLYLDLVDMINELWASGAEAMAINDHRIISTSAFGDREGIDNIYITVNGERLYFPIVIKAIGEPATLQTGLSFPGGIVDNFRTYGITLNIQQHSELIIPAAKNISPWRYAKVGPAHPPPPPQLNPGVVPGETTKPDNGTKTSPNSAPLTSP